MTGLKIAEDHEHFICDGKPFFWVADTVWSAFTNPTFEEWQEYLSCRKTQGFNVLQINTLPQWDRVLPDLGVYPYPVSASGAFDWKADPNPEYITRSQKICQMAVDAGFHLALVVDWADIVPGTWLTKLFPDHAWPIEAVEQHAGRVVELYDQFAPVYIVSGDTDLNTQETIDYYLRTIEVLKEEAPASLRTMHLCGCYIGLTPALAEGLDFYVYQSGHGKDSVEHLEDLPRTLREKFPGKPILNAEPCYEEMPKIDSEWMKKPVEFWHADDVLEASRRSILAGARAGITYGANGLWNWRRSKDPLSSGSMAGNLYAEPAFWRDAMHFPGAGKIAALKELAY